MLGISDGDLQCEIAQKIIDEDMSVRELERLIKSINKEAAEETRDIKDKELNHYYKDIREKLQDYFGTKVSLSNKKNKGKIEIEYYSEEDLQRILDIINL